MELGFLLPQLPRSVIPGKNLGMGATASTERPPILCYLLVEKTKSAKNGRFLDSDKKSNENTEETGTAIMAKVWKRLEKRGRKESWLWIKETRTCK